MTYLALALGGVALAAYVVFALFRIRAIWKGDDAPLGDPALSRALDRFDDAEKRRRYPDHPDPTTDRRIR